LGGQSSILLFITFFTFGMAAILVKVPPEMGGALVVGIIVFISTFMSAEAGLYLLIVSMLLSPEFGAGGLGDGTDTTSSRGVTLRAEGRCCIKKFEGRSLYCSGSELTFSTL
jgi:hypothetical protein